MSHHANQCRREAILARHQSAQIEDPAVKRLFQDAARSWEVLAEQAEWLEQKHRSLSELQAMQQQEQVQPKGGPLRRKIALIALALLATTGVACAACMFR